MTCPGCGEAPPTGARFCPACGTSLATEAIVGERRVVTVVFADLAGFTTMAEGRDPEAVKQLLDGCFGVLVPVIDAHGGTVDKIIGDELMAVFGAPRTHEDDPERAVRAALALLDALEQLDPSLEMRIGINTGEVLAGPVGPGGASTVTGDTVNTAHRLVGVAAPGAVLVGERTHLLTEHAIDYGPPEPLVLRGRQEPVVAHTALGVRHRPGAGLGPAPRGPLVGRDEDLAALVELVRASAQQRRRALVTLIGEAGVGKTRLVAELPEALHAAGVPADVVTTHCAAYGGEGPLAPLAALVARALGLGFGDPGVDQLTIVERLRAIPALEGTDHRYLAHRVLQLLQPAASDRPTGEPTPARRRVAGELIQVARTVIGAAAGGLPLVVVFDDVHFAGDELLDHLERFGATGHDGTAAVLVAVGREELVDVRPALVTPVGDHHHVVRLGPLGIEPSTELLHRTLADVDGRAGTLAPTTAAEIVRAAGGNPLLLDQLARYLRETGALEAIEGGWRMVGSLTDAGLPDGARALLGARLDGLPAPERAIVQGAAVVGLTFSTPVLEVMGIDASVEALQHLEARGLLWRIGGLGSLGTYAFRHAMVRDAAYASVPLSDRATRHALVATWILDRAAGGAATDLGAVAHHVERAVALAAELGQTRPPLSDDAARSLLRAARSSRQRDELRDAEHWYRCAIELGLVDPDEVVAVRLEHGGTLLALRRLVEATAAYEAALVAGSSPAQVGEAATGLGAVARLRGDIDDSEARFAEGAAAWAEAGDRLGQATALRTHGWAELVAGRPGAARPKLERARAVEDELGARRGVTLQCLAWSDFQLGDHASARQHLWEAGQALSASDDRLELAWCFTILGNSLWQEGRVAQAQATAENLLDGSRQLGDLWGEGSCLVLLGGCLLEAGDVDGARARATEAIRAFTELDDPWGGATALLLLGMVERVAGALDAARTCLERGLAIADQVASVGAKARLRAELAATLLDLGEHWLAVDLARATLDQVRGGAGDRDSEIRALVVLAKRARIAGELRSARGHLDEAIALADGEVRTSIWRRAMAWSAIVAVESGDARRGEQEAAAAAQGSWESARTWVLAQRAVAAAQAANGNPAGALATLDAVLGRFRDRPLAFLHGVHDEVLALQGSQ